MRIHWTYRNDARIVVTQWLEWGAAGLALMLAAAVVGLALAVAALLMTAEVVLGDCEL